MSDEKKKERIQGFYDGRKASGMLERVGCVKKTDIFVGGVLGRACSAQCWQARGRSRTVPQLLGTRKGGGKSIRLFETGVSTEEESGKRKIRERREPAGETAEVLETGRKAGKE